jgi:hypothetical protein
MKKYLLTGLCISIFGCGVAPIDKATSALDEKKSDNARDKMMSSILTPLQGRVTESGKVVIPVVPAMNIDSTSPTAWLSNRRVRLDLNKPLPLNEVIKMFWSQGINISTTLPVDSYTYGGLGVNNTDAETALKMVLSSVGLDYELDNIRKLVLIKPMASKTWYLNLGNRTSTYTSGGAGAQPASGGSGSSSGGSTMTVSGSTGISSSDNFWVSLNTELTKRLTILVPNSSAKQTSSLESLASPIPTPLSLNQPIPASITPTGTAPATQGGASTAGLYTSKKVGEFSVNPETGAVTIQAPHWILDEMNTYLKRIQDMYNTDLTFYGELVLLTTDTGKSEGFDISSFGRYANSNYGFGIKNNSLGGVTVSVPETGFPVPIITAATTPISSTLIGITGLTNGLQVFNAYLSKHGTVQVLQNPILTTTSGVPVEFSKIVTEYFNSVSQQASTGNTGGAATATQNTLVAVDLGTVIKINPRFDVSTGLIRAQITLYQSLKSGTQVVNQSLSAGNTVQQVGVPIPTVTKLNYSGEALLQDGDMIIVGGQKDDSGSNDSDGVTGLKDSIVGGVFGKKGATTRSSTYYFALRVTAHKRVIDSVKN